MMDDFERAPVEPGSCPSDRAAERPAPSGFDPSRAAAPFTRDEIQVLYDECRGWHSCLDHGRIGDGAFTIHCENGESEQTRLNLRATLRDLATVLAGILSADASGIDVPKGPEPQGPAVG